ncbi:hypothetical protein [Cohnella fermenti]|uniref:LysM domain-containing protein n=1 Tax=Cohnella fermenti TaxID=2565925 RepID=A0A4S4BJJ7_9BACL|nr:hypothetical protein [Cohnella fermenti]THF73873.1 hypothetical protein E6C55_27585 [Cohnella fermenti]
MNPNKSNTWKRPLLAAAFALALSAAMTPVASPASAETDAAPPASLHEHHGHPSPLDLEAMGAISSEGTDSLLKLLKLDETTLRNRLRAGETLADIAKSQGVSKQKVIDLLVKMQKERIAEAVKAGRLTTDQAKKINERLVEHTTRLVEGTGPSWNGQGHKGEGHRHSKRLDETAQVLGIPAETLIQELKNGKTIAQIGKEKGISEDALVAKLLEKEKARIQERIHRVWSKTNQAKETTTETATPTPATP